MTLPRAYAIIRMINCDNFSEALCLMRQNLHPTWNETLTMGAGAPLPCPADVLCLMRQELHPTYKEPLTTGSRGWPLVTMVEKVVTLVVDFFVALLYNVCDGLVTCG